MLHATGASATWSLSVALYAKVHVQGMYWGSFTPFVMYKRDNQFCIASKSIFKPSCQYLWQVNTQRESGNTV